MEEIDFYRKEGLARRAALTLGRRSLASRKIAENVIEQLAGKETVFCYLSYQYEVATFSLIQDLLAEGVRVAIPQTDYHLKKLTPVLVDRDSIGSALVKDRYGIHEPDKSFARKNSLAPDELDVVLCPGTAFSRLGGRLGYGGGFYDRFLADKIVQKIGLSFACQLFPFFPEKETDISMDVIVTEDEIIDFH